MNWRCCAAPNCTSSAVWTLPNDTLERGLRLQKLGMEGFPANATKTESWAQGSNHTRGLNCPVQWTVGRRVIFSSDRS